MTTEEKSPNDEFAAFIADLQSAATPNAYTRVLEVGIPRMELVGNRMQAQFSRLVDCIAPGPIRDALIVLSNYLNMTTLLQTIGMRPESLMGSVARTEIEKGEAAERAEKASNLIQSWHRSGVPESVIRARCEKAEIAYEERRS